MVDILETHWVIIIFYSKWSNVDYGIVSKCLLPSVKYFCTKDPNYLSDHLQIYFVLSCNINSSYKICKNNSILKKGFKYKWTTESKEKLDQLLSSREFIDQIIDFEKNAEGIYLASEELRTIFDNMSKNACMVKTPVF